MAVPQDSDPTIIAQQWLADFAAALYAGDPNAVAHTMQPGGWLRDILTFSWNSRTLEGREKMTAFLSDKLLATKVANVKMTHNPYMQPKWFTLGPAQGVEFGYTYETPIAYGGGYARLLERDGEWKGHTVAMIVTDLKGHEELSGRYTFETLTDGKPWGEFTTAQKAKWETDPYVVIGKYRKV